MPLLAHLTDADIQRHVAGVPSTETDRHVRVCLNCAQRLGDAAQRIVRWERRGLLGRLVRIDSRQMIEELLAENGGRTEVARGVKAPQAAMCARSGHLEDRLPRVSESPGAGEHRLGERRRRSDAWNLVDYRASRKVEQRPAGGGVSYRQRASIAWWRRLNPKTHRP